MSLRCCLFFFTPSINLFFGAWTKKNRKPWLTISTKNYYKQTQTIPFTCRFV
jgi:hypothetical protein